MFIRILLVLYLILKTSPNLHLCFSEDKLYEQLRVHSILLKFDRQCTCDVT
jgi:hypothetical protein